MVRVFSYCLQIDVERQLDAKMGSHTPDDLIQVLTISIRRNYLIKQNEFANMGAIMAEYKDRIRYTAPPNA